MSPGAEDGTETDGDRGTNASALTGVPSEDHVTSGPKERTSIERAFPTVRIPPLKSGIFCLLLTCLTLGIFRFYLVPQGFVLVVMAFEKYRTYRKPGLSAIVSLCGLYHYPWQHLVPTAEQQENFHSYAATSDQINCHVQAVFSYKIVDPGKAIFEVVDFESLIKNIALGHVRDECGKRSFADLIRARTEMAQAAREALTLPAERWGLAINLFEVVAISKVGEGAGQITQ
jgi:regulator of protease activity HflC (stomatin/prohibitin superfamily)